MRKTKQRRPGPDRPRNGALHGKLYPVPEEFIVDGDLLELPGEDEMEHEYDGPYAANRLSSNDRNKEISRRYYGKPERNND